LSPTSQRRVASAIAALVLAGTAAVVIAARREAPHPLAPSFHKKTRPHFDHAPVMPASFDSPQDVTRRCLECHDGARSIMKTSHWLWLGEETAIPGRAGKYRVGKANLINNFCIAARGNEPRRRCEVGRLPGVFLGGPHPRAPGQPAWQFAYAAGASLPSSWPELPTSHAFQFPCEPVADASHEAHGGHGITWPEHAYTKRVKLQVKSVVKGGCG